MSFVSCWLTFSWCPSSESKDCRARSILAKSSSEMREIATSTFMASGGSGGVAVLHRFTVKTTPNPRIRRTPAHVIFSRVARDLSRRVNRNRCVSQNSRSHTSHSMSHAPSLLFPSHLSTTSLSTCTPVRPSIRPSTRPSLLSTSHGDLPCADPSNVSFGPLNSTRLQVMSPKISLERTPQNWSNRCSSTDRV